MLISSLLGRDPLSKSRINHELLLANLPALKAIQAQRARRKIDSYYPDTGPLSWACYPKHTAFFEAGAKWSERCILAANRIGKTEGIGAYEATCHATGVYPKNWKGRRFSKPTNGWAAGDTSKTVKEIIQAKLLGPPGNLGTGMLPADSIVRTTTRTGLADAVDTIHVKHISGGTSTIVLKSYDQRREAFQGTERDWIWLDEEPPLDIYTECVMRTMATGLFKGGIIFITFTPVNGWTEVVDLYMDQTGREKAGRFLITASWDDAPHLSTAEKDKIYASLPPHQRDARSRGIPALGSGAIYPISEEAISCEPFELPDWWPRAYGLDVGWNRTAAIWGARDNDSGTVYLYGEHYYAHSEASENSRAIKARGEWIPGVIDPASKGRSQADGQQLLNNYIQNGLDVSTAINAREAGIYAVWQAMLAGKLKVFKSCASWWVEFRKYRRDDDGKIVKENDHLMDATRYFWMSGRDRMIVAPTQQINKPQERFHGSNGWMASLFWLNVIPGVAIYEILNAGAAHIEHLC